VKVSGLCFGTMTFGGDADEATSAALFARCREAGVNYFDTADAYTNGRSEEILGKLMADCRDELVVATKFSSPIRAGDVNARGGSRRHVREAVEASLRRLGTDRIDLYYVHFPDPDTPLDETLRALDDLVRQGKVRYLGASNHHAWRLARALWESDKRGYARYESLQPKYNLVFRDEYERELEPLCLEQGVGVIPYSSLGSGFLSGKYRRDGTLPTTARAANVQKIYMTDRGFAVLAAVEQVAAGLGATPAQVALSWLAHRPGITAPIASATSVAQLKELLGGIDLRLDAEATATLDRASAWREA
jgi:aryl-alcohol dehydrogenase-like predicted oxidoreductase